MNDILYPQIEPYRTGYLERKGHRIYYELSGNPNGPAALFLHGGPGGGTSPRCRRFFDPSYYRIVLMDQRGSGKSIPNVSDQYETALKDNTTEFLIEDIELLREKLGLWSWRLILGGSWGSTLALAYAQAHPQQVSQLLLRGIFTFMPDEVDSLFQNGRTADHYPDEWNAYVNYIKDTSNNWEIEKHNLLGAYQNRLMNSDHRMEAAKAFVEYELSISHLHRNEERIKTVLAQPEQLVPFAALEVHYMLNAGFLKRGELIDEIENIKNHRIHIVHGRNDTVCLPKAAARLKNALIASGSTRVTLEYIEAAGHSDSEIPIAHALRKATDDLAQNI
ncbi:MAG: prolyl aminopeptidase [Proteobacteria bacterium]|nr:prolyl aminopeptidase [Pseudomonadota bacterium]